MIVHQTHIGNINNFVARSFSGFNGDSLPAVDRIFNLRSGFLCAACSFRREHAKVQDYHVYIFDIASVRRCIAGSHELRGQLFLGRGCCIAFRPKGKFPFSCSAVKRDARRPKKKGRNHLILLLRR